MEVLIALGSNLGDRHANLEFAIKEISNKIGQICAQSSICETQPEFPPGVTAEIQGAFLNAVVACQSDLSAQEILVQLLEIEQLRGRQRSGAKRYQARTLDLDLLAYGCLVLNQPDLVLPHPLMHTRRFVLEPLAEIRPKWRHPVSGKSVAEMVELVGK